LKEKHINVTGEALQGQRDGEMSEIVPASKESSNSELKQSQKGMVLPFAPLSVAFDNIRYSVDMPAVIVLASCSVLYSYVNYLDISYF
jgi:hypothetical protein